MKIDCFTHILPKKYIEQFDKAANNLFSKNFKFGNVLEELTNVDMRLRMMDKLGVDKQVLTLAAPPIEEVVEDPKVAAELAKVANDGIAEIVAKHPDRFIGVAAIAMNNMDAALGETERAINQLGMKGVLIYSNCQGKPIDGPEFISFYELMAKIDLPIWLHPARTPKRADYVNEESSRYAIWHIFGWPFETTMAMTRIIFTGIFDRHPNLKIITHHAGAMLPYFDKRIEKVYHLFRAGGDLVEDLGKLQKPVLEYYRMFYNDTAVMGSVGAMHAAYAFFGHQKILFGTDSPFDTKGGETFTRDTIFSIDAMPIPPQEKDDIYYKNLCSLLKLK